MNDSDGRKIDRKALEVIRIRAVQRVEAGESPETVIKALGFSRTLIYEWLAKYREGGLDALRSRKAPGKMPKLNAQQINRVYRLVVGTDPRELKFEFALWTRSMVRDLIEREFNVTMSDVSVGRLLKKFGLRPQRFKHRTIQRDELSVSRWMAEDYRKIRKLASENNAEIYFSDKLSASSDCYSGATWALKGKTPAVKTTETPLGVNLISAFRGRGALRFMVTEELVTASVFIEFLQRLIHNSSRLIFLIVDNDAVNCSREVSEFVRDSDVRLKLFFLPPYSAEFNPDEHIRNSLRNHKIGR
ncbi:IS630 family transposase [Desulforhopalus singaporensis]|uniref:Transposase n=1 Tax=Desulforhopalus singaporensis TaxID=91360 RepID=A0A1H0VRT2_9BACT|nr:IS630 family transposase [Desulforhopalus singaporensis]SDP81292.1 Transposase [Desulforhopalus singaporensis]